MITLYIQKGYSVKGKVEKMDTDKIIERAYELSGAKNYTQLAEKLGISKTNFNGRKKRGTLDELLLKWAKENKYNLDFLFYGIENDSKEIQNEVLKNIQEWINDSGQNSTEMNFWFKVQFENKFPEYIEWKKRKEEQQMQDNNSANSKVA